MIGDIIKEIEGCWKKKREIVEMWDWKKEYGL